MTDEAFMARALELAKRAEGRTRPNPVVGCVLVRDGEIIGEGWHKMAGGPHAEVMALQQAGDARGATAYVTLEPCSYHGRTPPCASALIREGIKRVVIGALDPNPRVSGEGANQLRGAGVEVVVGVLEAECIEVNLPFFKLIQSGYPWVVAKWAMTLDGKIASRSGDASWVTGELARQRVHEVRNALDAILVGANTVRLDNPRLTCRIEGGRDPIRVVLDSHLSVDPSSRVFETPGTIVFCASTAPVTSYTPFLARGAELVSVPRVDGKLDVMAVLTELGARGIMSVLVEGGGAVLGSFLDAGAIDRVMVFIAPKIVGGAQAASPIAGLGFETMGQARRLNSPRVERLGEDVLVAGNLE